MTLQMLEIWSLVPLPFLNSACTSGSSQFTFCWSLVWRVLSIILLTWGMSTIVWYFEHSLALPFFGIGMKTDLFQSCGHCWVFQICWQTECSTLTASPFQILNSPTRIPQPRKELLDWLPLYVPWSFPSCKEDLKLRGGWLEMKRL